jgi:hypothetical protein
MVEMSLELFANFVFLCVCLARNCFARVFIGRLLSITPQQKGWGMYAQLLIDLFKFLAPFLRNAELSKPVSMLYKGTLRVLLILLHDFPEFLLFCTLQSSHTRGRKKIK